VENKTDYVACLENAINSIITEIYKINFRGFSDAGLLKFK